MAQLGELQLHAGDDNLATFRRPTDGTGNRLYQAVVTGTCTQDGSERLAAHMAQRRRQSKPDGRPRVDSTSSPNSVVSSSNAIRRTIQFADKHLSAHVELRVDLTKKSRSLVDVCSYSRRSRLDDRIERSPFVSEWVEWPMVYAVARL